MVSELRVRSFGLRAAFEEVTSALLLNVRCGFWLQARQAALDLAGFLTLVSIKKLQAVHTATHPAAKLERAPASLATEAAQESEG